MSSWGLWLPNLVKPRLHLALFVGSGAWTSRCNELERCTVTDEEGLGWDVENATGLLREFDWFDRPRRVAALAVLDKAPADLLLCKRCVDRWLSESYVIETERLRRVG